MNIEIKGCGKVVKRRYIGEIPFCNPAHYCIHCQALSDCISIINDIKRDSEEGEYVYIEELKQRLEKLVKA